MAIENDKVISTLNDLIETLKDGQNGFREAAEGIDNSDLKALFFAYSQERARFAGELQNEVRRLGGDPEKTGSLGASLHRGWMSIKSAIADHEERPIISECERGEDSAVSNYQDALKQNLPADLRSIVERQYAQIQEAHDRIRNLERAAGQ
jgi:uncharacterized protein (TIGR02284 family)